MIQKAPKVSVIVPCYNVENYLSACLDSVLNQTFKDLEIICVEDCSIDKTKDILKKYEKKYKKIRIIQNKTNQGLAISRNLGINQACGDYIYFLDSDDTISPNCIDVLYKKIIKDKCDVVIGAIDAYAEDKNNEDCVNRTKFMHKWLAFKPFTKLQITKRNSDEYSNNLYCCAVNKLYKKSFLLDNKIYFINKNCFHEDNGFWLKIMACNPIMSGITTKTYFYRIRNKSITLDVVSDHKKHLEHLKMSLLDAMSFVKIKGSKHLYRFIHFEIYKLKQHKLFYFVWTKFEKRLKVLFIPLFGLVLDSDRYKLKFFGIPVCKWNKK